MKPTTTGIAFSLNPLNRFSFSTTTQVPPRCFSRWEYGRGYFWAGQATRAYRGALQLLPFPAGMTIVNQLTMEEYLYAVVPSEMPSSWPAAALQAQAIAARTYAFANLGRYRQRGFDLLGSVASQAYNGVTGETAAVRKAVDATRG